MSIRLGIWAPNHCGEFLVRKASEGNRDDGFELAKQVIMTADRAGFEYTLVAARFMGATLEPITTTAALAMVTRRIRFMVAIHSGLLAPQMVAKMGACLDQITEGRFHINLISGWWEEQHKMYGGRWAPHDERYAVSQEFIRVIKGMWTEELFSFHGKYYDVEDATLQPKPFQKPCPPTFVGGTSDAAHELAAREGDWYFISGAAPAEMPAIIDRVREKAARYGREVRFAVSGFVLQRETMAKAQAEAARLAELGKHDSLARIHTSMLITDWIGPAARIAERFEELSQIGVEMALIQMTPIQQALDAFCERVLPRLDLASADAA